MNGLRTELMQDGKGRLLINGREDLWDEYCRLRKEVKQLVIERSLIFEMSLLGK